MKRKPNEEEVKWIASISDFSIVKTKVDYPDLSLDSLKSLQIHTETFNKGTDVKKNPVANCLYLERDNHHKNIVNLAYLLQKALADSSNIQVQDGERQVMFYLRETLSQKGQKRVRLYGWIAKDKLGQLCDYLKEHQTSKQL